MGYTTMPIPALKRGAAPVVVGVDGCAHSRHALAWAARYAAVAGAPLRALAVWHVPSSYGWSLPLPWDWDPEADTRADLERAVREVLGAASEVPVRLDVVEGPPGKALVDASSHASLVVVGRRGRHELRGALFGAVSPFVVAHARCPVVVVHEEPSTGVAAA